MAVLADGSNVTKEGKLNIFGIFDAIHLREFPGTHSLAHLILQFECNAVEFGQTKEIRIIAIDADGKRLAEFGANLEIAQQRDLLNLKVNFPIPVKQMRFETPGDYDFIILISGEEKKRVSFKVLETEARNE